jgi:predicted enzyme related to lactoylglutathione lyase
MTAYAAGTFCWPELGTTDQSAAIEFYKKLFGWTTVDMPLPDGVYSMIKLGKDDVGAAYQLMPDMVKQGVPPNWLAYIAVDDVDAAAKKVAANGGTVVMGPMDVKPDGKHLIGRMAVVQDPEKASFGLWQAGSHIGATLVNEPGTLTWNELMTHDAKAAKKFYTAVFGYGVSEMDMGDMIYTVLKVGDRQSGGIMPIPAEMKGMPANWMTYFAVDDVDKRAKIATSAGGKIVGEPHDVPGVGRFAMLQDPQGAMFSILKMA